VTPNCFVGSRLKPLSHPTCGTIYHQPLPISSLRLRLARQILASHGVIVLSNVHVRDIAISIFMV
jgi:hypothetical protein